MSYAKKSPWFYVILVIGTFTALYVSSSIDRAQAQSTSSNPTRRQVMWNAEHYRLCTWVPSTNNVGTRSGWAWSSCQQQNVWTTIMSDFCAGQVAVVNVSANNGSGDVAMSYNGFNR